MRDTQPWIAVYDDPDRAAAALRSLDGLGVRGARIVSPAAYQAVHLTGRPGPWRLMGWLALAGGILGLAVAVALEVGSSIAHPVDVGGKPVVAWIPYGVVMFELTMLGAGVTNFLALVVLAWTSRRRIPKAVRQAVASDRLAVVVPAAGDDDRLTAIQATLAGAIHLEGAR
jgi:Alternative complex III, ActD subunit